MSKFKVLIADNRYPHYKQEEAVLAQINAEIIYERSSDEARLAAVVEDIDGLIVNLAPITAKVINAMKKCKCVSRYGVGYDNVDTEALKKKGIILANVPDYCIEDVSDHAFALFMDCVRKISRKDRNVRQGKWNLTGIQPVYRIRGKTFGFVGFGAIARRFYEKLKGFDLGRVLVYDPYLPPDTIRSAGCEPSDLDTLCKEADFISLHAPVTPSSRGMFNASKFALMKKTAILINTARGGLIDEPSLINALKTGQIACAGLDVYATEPLPEDSELRKLENVTLTDHAAWYSEESIVELKTKAAINIVEALTGKKVKYQVKL
jgi:D-3-phosphoglycerate dehydrogenase